jgi:preprotein translocase subunit SecF
MKRKPITLELGGKLSIKDMKGLLKASYKKNNKDVNNFEIDNDLSTKKVKVFKDKDTNQVVVSHRGTSDLKDVITDVKMLFGNYKNDPRYKESKKVQQLAQDKYGKENITTVGHSLGAKLAEDLGRDTKEIITFNKPTLPID